MRNLTPVIAAVLVLAGCSSASTVTAPDLAACDRAMRAQDAATAAGGATATRPPECAGVGDTDLQRLASSALADAVSSSLAVPPPSSTIAAPTTAAGRLTTAQAAAVYAAAVAPVNAIGEQLKDAIKGPVPDMTKVHQLAAKLKTAYRRVLDTLLHTSWPVEVQAAVDSLATTTAALGQLGGDRNPGRDADRDTAEPVRWQCGTAGPREARPTSLLTGLQTHEAPPTSLAYEVGGVVVSARPPGCTG